MNQNNDGLRGFALNHILNNLNLQQRSSPQAQSMIQAIQNNDATTGQQIADNICRSYGFTREQMVCRVLSDLGLGGG